MSVRVAQRQNARRTRKTGHAVPLILFLLVLTTCGALLWAASTRLGLCGREFSVTEGLDPRAESLHEGFFAALGHENNRDQLSYRINRRIELEPGGPAALCLGNPLRNSFLLRAEIRLDESGAVLFSSGLLLPGRQIRSAVLDTTLEVGEHAATARFYAIDPVSLAELGWVSEPLTVTVLS